MRPPLSEQADSSKSKYFHSEAGGYHQYLKALTSRINRHYAKQSLKQGDEPIDNTKRYKGWET